MKAEATIQKAETINRAMGIKEWSLIVILSILWGGSFFFVGVGTNAHRKWSCEHFKRHDTHF